MENTETMPSAETTEATAETSVETTEVPMTVEGDVDVTPETIYADKYKSVSDLETGYKELQSTFSKKMGAFEGAPEAYEFKEGYVQEDNQGLADVLTGWGKENQLSNNGLNSLVESYNSYRAQENETYMDAEYKKLGDNGGDRIKTAREFLEANIGVESTQGLAKNLNSAASIEAIEKLISMTKTPKVAPTQGQQIVDEAKIHELQFAKDEHGNRKMEDPKYRAKVLAMKASLLGMK